MQAGTTPKKRTSLNGRAAFKLMRLDGARRADQAAIDARATKASSSIAVALLLISSGAREDVLDLYAEAPDPERPLLCFDESPVQRIGEVRQPIPPEPGKRERYDYESRRNGTVNLFVAFDPHRAWRKVKVTERRTAVDYAHCMRELVDVHYPKAACIRVVQANLSIHAPGALYQAFATAE